MAQTLTTRQQEILNATLTVIEREGVKKFTMKNVAREIGVTDAALYKHFADKGAILVAVAALFKASTLESLEELRSRKDLDAVGKLEGFIKGRARQFQENRALSVTLFSEELFRDVAKVSSLNHDMMDNHAKQLVAIVQEGQEAGQIRRDLPAQHLILLLSGPMRLMVAGWKSDSGMGLNLVERVEGFWRTYHTIIKA